MNRLVIAAYRADPSTLAGGAVGASEGSPKRISDSMFEPLREGYHLPVRTADPGVSPTTRHTTQLNQ